MSTAQRKVVLIAGLLMVLMAIFPPWMGFHIADNMSPHPVYAEHRGYRFVLLPPSNTPSNGQAVINTGALLAQFVVLVGLTGIGYVSVPQDDARGS